MLGSNVELNAKATPAPYFRFAIIHSLLSWVFMSFLSFFVYRWYYAPLSILYPLARYIILLPYHPSGMQIPSQSIVSYFSFSHHLSLVPHYPETTPRVESGDYCNVLYCSGCSWTCWFEIRQVLLANRLPLPTHTYLAGNSRPRRRGMLSRRYVRT